MFQFPIGLPFMDDRSLTGPSALVLLLNAQAKRTLLISTATPKVAELEVMHVAL